MAITIGWARVSTSSDQQAGSLARQEEVLRSAGCDEIIAIAESGSQGERKGFRALGERVKAGGVDRILLVEADRLGRHLDLLSFLEQCDQKGVTVETIGGQVLSLNSADNLVASGVGVILAASYSKRLSERVKRSKASDRAKGKHGCAPPWGFRHSSDGRLEVDPELEEEARSIIGRIMETSSTRRVWATLNGTWKPSLSGLRLWWKNPALRGGTWYRTSGEVAWGTHEGLVDAATWERANNRIKGQHGQAGRAKDPDKFPLSKLIRCGGCGRNLQHRPHRGRLYLECAARKADCAAGGRRVLEPWVRSRVAEALRIMAWNYRQPDSEQSIDSPEIIGRLDKIENLKNMASTVPEVREAVKRLQHEVEMLRSNKPVVLDPGLLEALRGPIFEWYFVGATGPATGMRRILHEMEFRAEIQWRPPQANGTPEHGITWTTVDNPKPMAIPPWAKISPLSPLSGLPEVPYRLDIASQL